uniref:Mantis fibroin 1 n=1 Tax=Pseudomantis albofimbriata TaxID=627833 RepID=I3PM87_9NEOP|nr:mantis fibroin 1 [Pseudomantis albofimbriata]
MDSKMLCVSLLLAVFCLWYTEASPLEEKYGEKYGDMEEYQRGTEDSRAVINDHTAKVASQSARGMVNKAKTTEAAARSNEQLSKDRQYYYREYLKKADYHKKKALEYEQLSAAENAKIAYHESKQKDWETKARESDVQCRDAEAKYEQSYTRSRELKRESIIAYVQAAMHHAEASGDHMKADRAKDIARDMMRKAESLRGDASNHYQRSEEDKNKARSEKVKAHQNADNSQRHHTACRAYDQEGLKTRLSSKANMMRQIHSSLLAERSHSLAREDGLAADLSHKLAEELARMSEESGAISKINSGEERGYSNKVRQDEVKAHELAVSKRMMGAEVADNSEMISLAQAKDGSLDEGENYKLSTFYADDSTKNMLPDSRGQMSYGDE